VPPRVNTELPQTLIWTGGSSGWGEPGFEWADLSNPEAAPFVLDNVAEEREWGGFTRELRGVAHSLNTLHAKLNNVADPCQV
jgi:hypothetical protein